MIQLVDVLGGLFALLGVSFGLRSQGLCAGHKVKLRLVVVVFKVINNLIDIGVVPLASKLKYLVHVLRFTVIPSRVLVHVFDVQLDL